MKFQFSGHVILYGYEMSPGQFSSKKRTNYDFFGYVKDWPHEVAKKVTSWQEKPNSFAVDNYRPVKATVKLTAAMLF